MKKDMVKVKKADRMMRIQQVTFKASKVVTNHYDKIIDNVLVLCYLLNDVF